MTDMKFSKEINLFDIMNVIKKNLALLLIIPILAAFSTWFYLYYFVQPQYTSTAKLLIIKGTTGSDPTGTNWDNSVYADLMAVRQLSATYASILTSDGMCENVRNALNLNATNSRIASMISVKSVNETGLDVSVTNTDANKAQQIVLQVINYANKEIKKSSTAGAVTVLNYPTVPTLPSSPAKTKSATIAFIIAFCVLFLLLLGIEIFDDRVKNSEEFEEAFGLPVLGIIPLLKDDK